MKTYVSVGIGVFVGFMLGVAGEGLRKAGIAFTVDTQDGKEFVRWSANDNAAVEAIQKALDQSLPEGRAVA